MKHKVMVGDIPCWWRRLEAISNSRIMEKYPVERFCPVCGEEIDQLDGRVIIINNYVMFPNISCHLACFSDDKAKETIIWIRDNYEKCKAALEEALDEGKPWFSHVKM